jgi:segregation and condensation protein B
MPLSRGGAAAGEWRRQWQRRRPAVVAVQLNSAPASARRTPRLARVEAALFVSERPLSARRLAQHAALVDVADVVSAVDELNAAYDADGSAFRIEHVATGYQLLTRQQYAPWLEKVHERRARLRLSPPALETLAIVAYRQPLTRADVEAVRGVQSGEMLKLLMERELVKIVGEHDSLGRPYLYGTTRQFLELFGLHSLAELPPGEGLAPPTAAQSETEGESDAETAEAA